MSFEIKPVTIDDKELFDKYFREYDGINSDFTFTNFFIWRKHYNIKYAIISGMLCVFSHYRDSAETVNFPLGQGDLNAVIETLAEYYNQKSQPLLIRLYKPSEIDALNCLSSRKFIATEDRNSFDYIYKVSDLIELPGSRYHGKRNHINKFLSQNEFEYQKITHENIDDCREMFNRWCKSKADTISNINEQQEAVSDFLDNFSKLDAVGGGIYVDNKLVAFSFGEVLNKNKSIAVIHLEHADTDFQGSFPLINQQFLINEWSDFEFVNREEDMGLPGLRNAKKSYHPVMMAKKYIASLI